VARLKGDPNDPHGKNIGFQPTTIKFSHKKKYNIVLYDIGGSPTIRDIWKRHNLCSRWR
jgi:hypothetical protein